MAEALRFIPLSEMNIGVSRDSLNTPEGVAPLKEQFKENAKKGHDMDFQLHFGQMLALRDAYAFDDDPKLKKQLLDAARDPFYIQETDIWVDDCVNVLEDFNPLFRDAKVQFDTRLLLREIKAATEFCGMNTPPQFAKGELRPKNLKEDARIAKSVLDIWKENWPVIEAKFKFGEEPKPPKPDDDTRPAADLKEPTPLPSSAVWVPEAAKTEQIPNSVDEIVVKLRGAYTEIPGETAEQRQARIKELHLPLLLSKLNTLLGLDNSDSMKLYHEKFDEWSKASTKLGRIFHFLGNPGTIDAITQLLQKAPPAYLRAYRDHIEGYDETIAAKDAQSRWNAYQKWQNGWVSLVTNIQEVGRDDARYQELHQAYVSNPDFISLVLSNSNPTPEQLAEGLAKVNEALAQRYEYEAQCDKKSITFIEDLARQNRWKLTEDQKGVTQLEGDNVPAYRYTTPSVLISTSPPESWDTRNILYVKPPDQVEPTADSDTADQADINPVTMPLSKLRDKLDQITGEREVIKPVISVWGYSESRNKAFPEMNEDSYFPKPDPEKPDIVSDDLIIAGVFDGLGGVTGGRAASHSAVSSLESFASDNQHPFTWEDFRKFFSDAEKVITKIPGAGMTTASVVNISPNEQGAFDVSWGSVGDSRVYVFDSQENRLKQISKDQSLVADKVDGDDNPLPRWKDFYYDKRNVVTDSLGDPNGDPNRFINYGEFKARKEDLVILLTDGVSDEFTRPQLERLIRVFLAHGQTPEQISKNLVQAVRDDYNETQRLNSRSKLEILRDKALGKDKVSNPRKKLDDATAVVIQLGSEKVEEKVVTEVPENIDPDILPKDFLRRIGLDPGEKFSHDALAEKIAKEAREII